jgi:hypothetical protein
MVAFAAIIESVRGWSGGDRQFFLVLANIHTSDNI